MTALALFPVKRIDKKVAFILGLATLFKSLYSLSELFAVRGGNFSDLLDLTVQLGLVFVFFSHYGLVKALSNPAQDLSFLLLLRLRGVDGRTGAGACRRKVGCYFFVRVVSSVPQESTIIIITTKINTFYISLSTLFRISHRQ